VQTALLFSTALDWCAQTLVRYYQARFQIEFLFRDAKQFLGLDDCQARGHESLQPCRLGCGASLLRHNPTKILKNRWVTLRLNPTYKTGAWERVNINNTLTL
jgi:hypothetical protein